MTLFTCKVGLELKWPKYYVLPEAGADNDNDNDNDNDVILTIKKLYVSIVTLSAKDNQKLSKH